MRANPLDLGPPTENNEKKGNKVKVSFINRPFFFSLFPFPVAIEKLRTLFLSIKFIFFSPLSFYYFSPCYSFFFFLLLSCFCSCSLRVDNSICPCSGIILRGLPLESGGPFSYWGDYWEFV